MKRNIVILFLVICFFSVFLFCVFNCFDGRKSFDEYVAEFSNKFDLNENFVFAVIKAESDFDEMAVSKSGARGLMQIMPSTGKWIASELGRTDFVLDDLFDAKTNIEFGCFYLNYLFDKFLDLKAVICAYNAGETVVRTWLDINGNLEVEKIEYEQTRVYLKRVLEFFEKYEKN